MLMRIDPLREFDRLVQQTTGGHLPVMPMDAYRHEDHFVVHFDVPGVDPSSIELTVENNVLAVSAERRWEPAEGDQVLVAERPQGSHSRQLFLGEGLDPERVQANYDNGVLRVTVPVAEHAKPRRVEISSGGGGVGKAQAIEADSSAA